MKIALVGTATVVGAKGQGGEGRRFGSVPTGITTHISPKSAVGGGGRDAFIPAHTLVRVFDPWRVPFAAAFIKECGLGLSQCASRCDITWPNSHY